MESEVGPEVVVGSQIENNAARKLIVEGTAKEIAGRYEAIAGLMAIEASEGYREFGYSSLVQFARGASEALAARTARPAAHRAQAPRGAGARPGFS